MSKKEKMMLSCNLQLTIISISMFYLLVHFLKFPIHSWYKGRQFGLRNTSVRYFNVKLIVTSWNRTQHQNFVTRQLMTLMKRARDGKKINSANFNQVSYFQLPEPLSLPEIQVRGLTCHFIVSLGPKELGASSTTQHLCN